MDIAEMAIRAAKADAEARDLEKQAQEARNRSHAERAIIQFANGIGLSVEPLNIERDSVMRSTYTATVPIEADVTLNIDAYVSSDEPVKVTATILPPAQLYWNLPPGVDEKSLYLGGTYGNYGLDRYSMHAVKSLEDLGRMILKVRSAREQWRRRWADDNGEGAKKYRQMEAHNKGNRS